MKPLAWGGAVSLGVLLLTALFLQGPVRALVAEAQQVETRRLKEAFQVPLARALARGDDLVRIDELRRLEQLPGVLQAHISSEGELQLQLSPLPWRVHRYHWIERFLTLAVLMLGLGVGAGWMLQKKQHQYRTRWRRHRKRLRERMERQRLQAVAQKAEEIVPWVHQAVSFSVTGLVLLDRHQSVVAFNRLAQERLEFPSAAWSAHWLDLKRSPAWAQALRTSLDRPGETIPLQLPEHAESIQLLTFPALGSTWILV